MGKYCSNGLEVQFRSDSKTYLVLSGQIRSKCLKLGTSLQQGCNFHHLDTIICSVLILGFKSGIGPSNTIHKRISPQIHYKKVLQFQFDRQS